MSGSVQDFIGTWEVYGCLSTANPRLRKQDFEGIRCTLDESGEISWSVPEEFSHIPIFACEVYEIYRTSSEFVIRFGAYNGHVFVFKTSQTDSKNKKDELKLACEDTGVMFCKKITEEKKAEQIKTTFSLLSALEDGYFSDITLISSNKKEFHVHSSILNLLGCSIDWKSDPPPFNNASEEVLATILHYLYAECLPENLTESTAKLVINESMQYECLTKLVNLCQAFLRNTELKQQIIGLVNDMHSCMNQIIANFTDKTPSDDIALNPSKLCFALKQSVCDGVMAGLKLLLLCDLLTKRQNELSKSERHEIIRYAKSRLPLFLSQFQKFLQLLKSIINRMSSANKLEFTRCLVPEIETFVDVFFLITMEIERILDHLIKHLKPDSTIPDAVVLTPKPDASNSKPSASHTLEATINKLMYKKELAKLKNIHDHIAFSLSFLSQKQSDFKELSLQQKMRSISRNIDQLADELPIFLIRLGGIMTALDEKLEWKEFKFCFKVGASKISYVLDKLTQYSDELEEIMVHICNLVQRDEFTQSLQQLGLLKPSAVTNSDSQKNSSDTFFMPLYTNNYNLNLVESFCVPPLPTNSELSEKCLQMFISETNPDMMLEISCSVDNSSSEELSPTEEKCVIQAHRVILAARCEWFKRALLSGMREAIDKKIVIHDTNPALFRIILELLYSGKLKDATFSTEQLIELLLLSDQFEIDSLKQTAEVLLQDKIDSDSALYFLSMADQYNASILKKSCLQYIAKHQKLTFTELFYELPINLQTEIFDYVWTCCPPRKSSAVDKLLSSDSNSSAESVHDFFKKDTDSQLKLSEDSSMEDLHLFHNPSRLESSIQEMRAIVGDNACREFLVRVILAADFDLCRAVNFYYERYSGNDQ